MSPSIRLLVYLLFLLSGATALAYQVTWVRNVTLIFGTSYQATSIVLAAFMGGLCIGGFLFGHLTDRIERPLRTYALLEIAIAAYALVLPTLLSAIDSIYVDAARAADGITPTIAALRVVMAGVALLPPTILMGATLPVLVSGLVDRQSEFGTRLSWLYGINTLGAVTGAVTTGFVLIPALGVWNTQITAVIVNVGIGALGLAIDHRLGVLRTASPAEEEAAQTPALALQTSERFAAHLAYRGAAVCGMSALALEVMWTRAVSHAVGTTTYSFTVMLASFLTGIWLGSWLHAAFPTRHMSPARQLAIVMVVIGLTGLAASHWIPRLPELVVQLNVALYGVVPRIQNLTTLLGGFAVMLVPCIFMGISFPLTGEARLSLGRSVGQSAGDTIGWNTLGSIVGSLLAGFVLIPFLGLQRGMILAAGLYLAYGALILVAPLIAQAGARRWLATGAATATVVLLLFAGRWLPEWDVRSLGGFQNNQLPFYVTRDGETKVREMIEDTVVRYYDEGRAATVSVVDMAGSYALLINGKVVATDTLIDMQNQLMLGHAPLLSHPDPKKALVVGLGTGFTLASLTGHQSLEEITLVEIEPKVIAAQPQFAPVNFDPLSDPRLRVEVQDGRNYLKTTREKFDVITADPIHPWNAGSGYLYTVEYYKTVRDRLTEGGVACQWLPIYGLSVENFKSIVATFNEVFPEVTLWQMGIDSVLVGSNAPFTFDLDRLAERLAEPGIEEQLRLIGVEQVHTFMAELALDNAAVRAYAKDGIVNRDDNLYLEFASPLSIGTQEGATSRIELNRARQRPLPDSLFENLTPADREALARARKAKHDTLEAYFTLRSTQERIRRAREILATEPGFGPAEWLLSEEIVKHARANRTPNALGPEVDALREAVALDPEFGGARRALGLALLRAGAFEEAITQFERSNALRPNRWTTLAQLSRAQVAAGRRDDALDSLRAAIEINPNNAVLNERLARLEAGG